MFITVMGWFAFVWALLILVGNLLIEPPGPWLPRVAAALMFVAYGATLVKRDRRAVPFTWAMVTLFGCAVLLAGLVPIHVLLWGALLGFALYLQRRRAALGGP